MDDRYIISMEAVWEIRRLLSSMRNHPNIYQALEIFDRLSQSIEIVGNEVCIKDEHPRIKKFMEREGSKEKPIGPVGSKAWSILTAMEKEEESMQVKNIAEMCHQVNKAYCECMGDQSQVNWEDAPDWQKESAIKGVEYHLATENAKPSDSHESWMKEKREKGWKYGPVKDIEKKEHPCFCPYDHLPREQQAKDYIFKAICDSFKNKSGDCDPDTVDQKVGQEVSDESQEIMEKDLGEPCDVVPDQG